MTETTTLAPTDTWHRGDWMQTLSGKAFYPLAPRADDLDIRDIAHSLAMQCRYNGHVRRFYSVAEHCVLMSDHVLGSKLATAELTTNQLALWALLHDAPEAYIGDMVRPLKLQMPEFRDAGDRIMAVIASRFSLVGGTTHRLEDGSSGLTLPPEVKAIDTRILLDERSALLATPPRDWAVGEIEPLGVTIRAWEPSIAKWEYLVRFQALQGALT